MDVLEKAGSADKDAFLPNKEMRKEQVPNQKILTLLIHGFAIGEYLVFGFEIPDSDIKSAVAHNSVNYHPL